MNRLEQINQELHDSETSLTQERDALLNQINSCLSLLEHHSPRYLPNLPLKENLQLFIAYTEHTELTLAQVREAHDFYKNA